MYAGSNGIKTNKV